MSTVKVNAWLKSMVNLDKSTVKYQESKDDISGWRKQVTSATMQARACGVRGGTWQRVEARDQPYRNFD